MKQGIQQELESLGEYGCYLLTLLHIGKVPEYLILKNYELFIEDGYIESDCTVLDPCAILKALTGKTYMVVKSGTFDPKADIAIAYWFNPRTKLHHFVLHNSNDEVEWDALGSSLTVKEGHPESYRLFYPKR